MFVIDASAMLALLLDERGADAVRAAPAGSEMSMVNVAEVFTRLVKLERDPEAAWQTLIDRGVRIRAFREDAALAVARLLPLTSHLGLSFGDRACLAQARSSGLPILTADQKWAQLDIGLDIRLIR